MFTSDHALKMEWLPDWLAIIGSGYIGLEFSDVYTALGKEVRAAGRAQRSARSCGAAAGAAGCGPAAGAPVAGRCRPAAAGWHDSA